MEDQYAPYDLENAGKSLPGPWPWYALLFIGFGLTGLFPWLMVAWALYQRRRKGLSFLIFLVNLAAFTFLSLALLRVNLGWWWLTFLVYLTNVLWALIAWIFQRRSLGPAPRRYILSQWKSWISPMVIGAAIGFCIATVLSVGPAFQNRAQMWQTWDILDRQTVLWDFFKYSILGIAAGFLVGFWWAGEGRRFRASHVVTFLSAVVSTTAVWVILAFFFIFLIHKGIPWNEVFFNSSHWVAIPPWVHGFRKHILYIQTFDISDLLAISLLFGAVSRIRDFAKRAALIPIAFLCVLPMSLIGTDWSDTIQGKIVYEMSSPNRHTRASAHKWAEIMLTRYPNHLQWPKIAESLARHYYQAGRFQESQVLYQKIIDRYSQSYQWHWLVGRARAAVNDPDFGKPSAGPKLEIPMVDYEDYLTHNWMALLSVIRYWEGPNVPESQVKIKLKDLSRSHDKILLSPLTSLADLDDAVRNLGYEIFILPAGLRGAKALVSAGIPVIYQHYNVFDIIFGFDEARSAVRAYSFQKLSKTLRKQSAQEAKEILSIEKEGGGESKKRMARIAREAYGEYAADFWESPALRYAGPLMAVAVPAKHAEAVATALNSSTDTLRKESDGYLATLIGFSYLHHADPVRAVQWARVAAGMMSDPMPLYVAHLAKVFWESRNKAVRSKIPLQDQFPELAQIFTFFNDPENLSFLHRARLCFDADLDANVLPWMIRETYVPMLDRSNPADLGRMKKAMRGSLSLNPADYGRWQALANTCQWDEDIPGMTEALIGAISSRPVDSKSKLRLAYAYVLTGRYWDAKEALNQSDPSEIQHDADYPFCLAAIAEWEGNIRKAKAKYKQSLEMRRYKPIYHLRYAKLLLKEGLEEEATKALKWAIRIDPDETIRKEAQALLLNTGEVRRFPIPKS